MFNNNEVAYYRGEVVTVIRAYHVGDELYLHIRYDDGSEEYLTGIETRTVVRFGEQNVDSEVISESEVDNEPQEELKNEVLEVVPEDAAPQDEFEEPVAYAIDKKGEETPIYNLQKFVEEHNMVLESVQMCLDGTQKTHKGFSFRLA